MYTAWIHTCIMQAVRGSSGSYAHEIVMESMCYLEMVLEGRHIPRCNIKSPDRRSTRICSRKRKRSRGTLGICEILKYNLSVVYLFSWPPFSIPVANNRSLRARKTPWDGRTIPTKLVLYEMTVDRLRSRKMLHALLVWIVICYV